MPYDEGNSEENIQITIEELDSVTKNLKVKMVPTTSPTSLNVQDDPTEMPEG